MPDLTTYAVDGSYVGIFQGTAAITPHWMEQDLVDKNKFWFVGDDDYVYSLSWPQAAGGTASVTQHSNINTLGSAISLGGASHTGSRRPGIVMGADNKQRYYFSFWRDVDLARPGNICYNLTDHTFTLAKYNWNSTTYWLNVDWQVCPSHGAWSWTFSGQGLIQQRMAVDATSMTQQTYNWGMCHIHNGMYGTDNTQWLKYQDNSGNKWKYVDMPNGTEEVSDVRTGPPTSFVVGTATWSCSYYSFNWYSVSPKCPTPVNPLSDSQGVSYLFRPASNGGAYATALIKYDGPNDTQVANYLLTSSAQTSTGYITQLNTGCLYEHPTDTTKKIVYYSGYDGSTPLNQMSVLMGKRIGYGEDDHWDPRVFQTVDTRVSSTAGITLIRANPPWLYVMKEGGDSGTMMLRYAANEDLQMSGSIYHILSS